MKSSRGWKSKCKSGRRFWDLKGKKGSCHPFREQNNTKQDETRDLEDLQKEMKILTTIILVQYSAYPDFSSCLVGWSSCGAVLTTSTQAVSAPLCPA